MGIDVGTSGCKVVLLDEDGLVLQQAHAEYPFSTPQPGWTEQNPSDWVAGVRAATEILGETKPDAIGLTGQMHGSVFLDHNGDVIRPALLWNDQRTSAECEEINDRVGRERIKEITGNPPLTGFQAPKILWLRNHEPESYSRIESVLLPKDYLRFVLSGVVATDASDASGTGFLGLESRDWSDEVLQALNLPKSFFPQVHESKVITGRTRGGFAGLTDGIPIVAGGGDQAAGAIGAGIVRPGPVSLSLGTSGVVFTALDRPTFDPSGRVHTFCHANGNWHAMGVMLSCGGAVEWVKKTLFPYISFTEFDELAAGAPCGSNGLIFQPYLAGERSPFIDPMARGAWQGLSLSTDASDLIRSVMEGVCFGLKGSYDVLTGLGARADEIRVSGGGAKSELWLQILADVFQVPVVKLLASEGPAFGAAILAGVGIGVWKSVEEAATHIRVEKPILPSGADYTAAIATFANAGIFQANPH